MNQFQTCYGTRKVWFVDLWKVAVVVGLAAIWILVMGSSSGGDEPVLKSLVNGPAAGAPADRAAVTGRLVAMSPDAGNKNPKTPVERPVTADETSREPATVEAAARVLDLRKFPVMTGARITGDMRSLGLLMYEAQGETQSAFEFQRKQLLERGWKELPGAYLDATNASASFTKDGFVVAVSSSDIGGDPKRAGWASVTLVNHGNIRTDKLPVPPGVKPFHPEVMAGSYLTEANVPETAEACRKLLLAAEWEPYGTAGNDPKSAMMYFKRNAIRVMAWVSSAEAEGGKTLIRYSTELLSADLPVPPDAPDPRYNDGDKSLRFEWPGEAADTVVAFYLKRLPKQGWEATTERPVFNEKWKTQYLIFRNEQGDMISLDLIKYTGIVRVKVQHRTAAEVKEMDRQLEELAERRRQELAQKSAAPRDSDPPRSGQRDPIPPDVPGVPDLNKLLKDVEKAAQEFEAPQQPAAKQPSAKKTAASTASGSFKVADVPIPKDVDQLEYSKITKMISLTSPSDARTLAKFWTDELAVRGWELPKPGMVDDDSAMMKWTRADATLSLFLHWKVDRSEVTLMSKGLDWSVVPASKKATLAKKQPADQPSTRPASGKDAGGDSPKTTAGTPAAKAAPAGRMTAPKITVADQKQSHATLTLGSKTYKLEYGVAYETKSSGQTQTEVLLSAKPIAVDKLVALLNKGESTFDAIGFEPHLKLQFDAAGKLKYYFFHAEGSNVGQGGDDLATAGITVKDGYARGKAVMDKPGEAFGDKYRFDAKIDAKLATGQAAAPAASTTEPATDDLVAEEHDGLPFPDNTTNRATTSSEYRKNVTATVPAETRTVADFYRRELTARGWKENAEAATATPGQTQLAFTNSTGGISVNLTRAGNDVRVNLVARDTEKAKSAGILPQPHRARLVLGNASNQEAVIIINDKQYKLAAGVGAKDPKDGTSLNVLPGKYNITLKVPGQPDATEELKVSLDETWGVIVLPTGGHFADQLY